MKDDIPSDTGVSGVTGPCLKSRPPSPAGGPVPTPTPRGARRHRADNQPDRRLLSSK